MKLNFLHLLNQLKSICNKFDGESNEAKIIFLETLSTKPIPFNKNTSEYLNVLLFLCAHPGNAETLILAESELTRMSLALKKASRREKTQFENSGLPFTPSLSTYTHELLQWMIIYPKINIGIDSFYKSEVDLSTALSLTLPSLEKEYTGMSYNNKGLLQILQVPKESQLSFILSEFSKLNDQPFVKDYFFNALQLYVKLIPKDEAFSKAYNRMPLQGHFFHTEIIKQFDQLALLNKKLPLPKKLSAPQFKEVLTVIKNSLALLQRETDPVTYMDERSFKLYELERGISIAIYGMKAERQLPLESYVGYTLFKNGYPAAYGGAWVFGKRALFGINIFEPYRGGESGFMMCQLLRVYRQAFGVDYFEVEPYQYGQGNPEGISSGAYWFYYRFGFRSLEPVLNKLAESEFEKIKQIKGYRSTEDILLRFTESNVALQLGKSVPLTVAEVRDKVTAYVSEKHAGNRIQAEKIVVKKTLEKIGKIKPLTKQQKKVLSETAFMSDVLHIQSASKIKAVHQMVLTKSEDLYGYQQNLLEALK
jgi:hypothetical protein